MFLLVFGIQEGQAYDWGTIVGPVSVWSLIGAGVVVLVAFVVWQARSPAEPLVRLGLFRDRNFSLANVAITTVGFAVTAMVFPIMFYAQAVLGLTPTGRRCCWCRWRWSPGHSPRSSGGSPTGCTRAVIAGIGLASWSVSMVWLAA